MRLQPQYPHRSRPRLRSLVIGAVITGALVAAGLLSASARALTQAAPHNTKEPVVSGNTVVGSTLSATNGDWTGTAPINYAYQWVRCPTSGGKPDGSDCASISGATTSSYVIGSADAGKRLRIRVTASNADGSVTVASNATATIASAASGRPRNTNAPSISGTLSPGATLHGDAGTWTGTQPITFTFQWLRCDARGGNCIELGGQTSDSYTLRNADSGHTLRIRVVARNRDGKRTALSGSTGVVSGGSNPNPGLPPGAIKLANGEISIPATSVPATERLVVANVSFAPNPVRSKSTPIAINIKVKDTRGYDVRDVLVFVRSTPLVTSTPDEGRTADDGTITYTVQPNANFPIRNGYNVQFFVKAHRQGDNPLAGIAAYRLVQVATAR
jgi:hypothetical protein